MRRHPLPALLFVWACDVAGIAVITRALITSGGHTPREWVYFAVWTTLLVAGHLGGIGFAGLGLYSGWFMAVDFAAAMTLPLPLFSLTMLIWFGVTVTKRLVSRHPEPFLGPDFNTANVTLDAFAALTVYQWVSGWLAGFEFASTVALLAAGITFLAVQDLLLTGLLSLDLRKHWRSVGTLEIDTMLADGLMVVTGAIISRIFLFDPYLLLLTLVVLVLLNRTLQRLQEAKLAYVDAKTGLYNYRFFDEKLAEGFKKAAQTREPLALVFADMDHLRDINNTHGHLVGDKALVAVARHFREQAGKDAIACRFGGEEFVLMIPDCTKVRAAEVAERIRRAVAAEVVPLENGGHLKVTVSLGVAVYPEDARTMEELVKSADEAVYESKNAGRNRVSVCHRGKSAAAAADMALGF